MMTEHYTVILKSKFRFRYYIKQIFSQLIAFPQNPSLNQTLHEAPPTGTSQPLEISWFISVYGVVVPWEMNPFYRVIEWLSLHNCSVSLITLHFVTLTPPPLIPCDTPQHKHPPRSPRRCYHHRYRALPRITCHSMFN